MLNKKSPGLPSACSGSVRITLRAGLWICGLTFALAARPAHGLDPHTALAHYGYQSWQTDTGLPQNTVHAIVQGRDGFLWIATEGGLVRFDGVNFAVMTRANTPGLPSDLVDDLMESRDGVLWISTSGGLAHMQSGKVQGFGPAQGMPSTQVWRTAQDANGRVWALTAAGLFRIDGQRGAERASRIALDEDLTENSSLVAGTDGALWVGTAEGVVRAQPVSHGGSVPAQSTFRPVGSAGEVVALAVDGRGVVWAGMRSGLEACSVAGCQSIAVPGGGAVNALAADAAGRMAVGADAGLFIANGDKLQRFPQADGGVGPGRVAFLYRDGHGMLWAGTAHGLMRILDGKSELLRGGDVYLAAAEDREGDLWLGTESGGLAVLRDRKFSTLTAEDGLTDDYVLALAQAPSGDVWAATKGGGLNVLRAANLHALTTAQGLASNVVLTVAAAPDGDVWAGTPDGLNWIHGGRVRIFTTADGLADDFVRSLYVGSRGALWIGTRRGLSRYANGQFTTWTALDGLGSDLIGAMTEDRDGNLWIGTLGGLTQLRDGHFKNFTTRDGLSSNVVTALYAQSDATLWIGTNDGGLNRMRAGKIARVVSGNLPERVLGILEDGAGYLWISSNSGVYRASLSGLNRMADTGAPAEVERFGVADGMRISECSSGGHPAALRLRDGTLHSLAPGTDAPETPGALWFATLKGIARVDPEHMPVNRVPPQVAIERVSVDDTPESGAARFRIAPGHSHYEFDYAGLSFVAPQKVEYRYELEGFDKDWVDAGTRRVAFYTNLQHGRYTFRVMARNNDGVWSRAAATTELIIEPHLYQTWWFRLLLVLALAGLAYAAWRRRLLRVEREFQAVLGERTRIAREIHDTLAQGFVAVSVQLELIAQLMHISADAAREQLDRARALVRSSLDDARSSIWELRSQTAEQEDLAARMLKMAEEVTAHAGARARLQMHVSGTYHPLDAAVERELLRIAREAVVNAVRHGDPENLVLRLDFDASMFGMEIRDDGRGFAGTPPDGHSGHFGMTGMRERAQSIGATLTVESAPQQGTRLRLALALARETEKRT